MAQKTNPVSTRFLGPSLWKNIWSTAPRHQNQEFSKVWLATHLVTRFYKNKNFDIVNIRIEQLHSSYILFVTIRRELLDKQVRFLSLVGFPKELDVDSTDTKEASLSKLYYPRLIRTLPKSIPSSKMRINSSWLTSLLTQIRTKKLKDDVQLIQTASTQELGFLLKTLRGILQKNVVLVKSHPASFIDILPSADYLALFVRNQLLTAVRRKKRIIPLRYFRTVSNYLMTKFIGYLRGIRLQIKGRLPKLGGSAGASRSKKQLLSLGYLSTQRLASPIDYSYVDLGSRSGICSVSVWVSYTSPLSKI